MLLEGADCFIQTRGLDVPIINCLLGHAVNRSELLAQPSQTAVTHPDDAAHNLSGVFGPGLFLFLEDFMHVGFACLQGRAVPGVERLGVVKGYRLAVLPAVLLTRSEEHTSELQSLR